MAQLRAYMAVPSFDNQRENLKTANELDENEA